MGEYYYWNDVFQDAGSMFRTPGSVTITNTGTYSSDSRTVRVTSSSNMERAERDPVGKITGWIKAESKGLYVYVGDGHTQSEELTGLVIKSGSGTLESPFVLGSYYVGDCKMQNEKLA